MRKLYIVLAYVILNVLPTYSITIFNETPEQIVFPKKKKNNSFESSLGVVKKPYDVLMYDLFLDWFNVLSNPTGMDSINRIWWGKNTITLKALEPNLGDIELDAVEFFIDSVLVEANNQKTKVLPTPKITNGKLTIALPTKMNLDDVCKISIYYTYARNIPESNYRGFFLYPKGKFVGRLPAPFYDSVFVEERIAYTMSEPEDARYWMPCNDAPYDKADAKISVKVPKGYLVASNGYLAEVATDGDTAKIFFWVSDKPLTTYLMAISASKYVMYSDWYRRVSSPNDSVEIQYYVWEKDFKATKTDGSEYNAKNTLQTTPKMMDFFSRIFLEYPFVKYGMVALMPFHFGGMEHQTISSINRVWLRQNVQFGIAHELAHQWIGDLVTCATWNDIWFNEGGATWSEALYAESLWGKSGYNYFLLSSRKEYLKKGGIELPAIYGLPINTIFGDYAVLVYQKASWVYHMLKENLGDSLFFKTFRKFLSDYAFKSVTTEEIIDYFKKNIKNPTFDLDTFFNQWLFKAGHPIFSLNAVIHRYPNDSGYFDAEISLFQVQNGNSVPEAFITPVRFLFKYQDSLIARTFATYDRISTFKLSLPFFPDSVFIDTTSVLCEVTDIYLSNLEKEQNLIEVFPNPIYDNRSLFVQFDEIVNYPVELSVLDLLGRKLIDKTLVTNGERKIFPIPEFSYLPKGTYIVTIASGRNIYYKIIQKV